MNFASWEGATDCTNGPEPGARALLAYLLEEYDQSSSLGIYNCRDVRGGSTTSTHGEGRAVDLRWPMSDAGRGTASGEAVVARLGEHGQRLGIQAIIYNRKIWSARSPDGRYYGGTHPHYDHHHIELTRASGRNLTLTTLRSVLGSTVHELGDRLLRLREPYMRGGDVREWQALVDVTADGIFGPVTEAATMDIQRELGVDPDGIVGPLTLAALERDAWPFIDVDPNSTFGKEIARAAELGLLHGYTDGSFGPYEPLSRAAAAALAVRLVDLLRDT